MKAANLQKLSDLGFNVPKFMIVDSRDVNQIQLTKDLEGCEKFAVRSSCDIEDSGNESFAGQFKTLLNVNKLDLIKAINEVFNSFEGKSGKVIIQEMIDSDISGVIFTSNPLGILNEMCINIGYGLGNNIVDNIKPTSLYYYNKDSKIFTRADNNKDTPDVEHQLLEKLIALGLEIEQSLNFKSDIEFSIKENKIYTLQARPITALNKSEQEIVLDNSNIVESYPGVILPLTQDFVKDVYYKIFRQLVIRITNRGVADSIDYNLKNMVDIVDWHFYYVIDNWYILLKLLPFSDKIIKIWQTSLGLQSKQITSNEINIESNGKKKLAKQFIIELKNINKSMNELNMSFENRYNTYTKKLEQTNDIGELIEICNNAKRDFLSNWDITLINDIYTFIYTALAKDNNVSNIDGLASLQQTKELNKLVYMYKHDSKMFSKELENYINKYGDRTIGELKLETITFKSKSDLLLKYIASADIIEDNKSATKEKGKYSKSFYNKTIGKLFIKKAKIGIKNREISRLNRSRLFGLARNIYLKIGYKLSVDNIIEDMEDIFYLHEDEINNAYNIKDIKSLIKDRKRIQQQYERYKMPNRLVFNGTILHDINRGNRISCNKNLDSLYGEVVSTGNTDEIYGEIIMINDPSININTQDKIIVTAMTDPGWSILIRESKAIITEQGSLLSHTAIISRELKKPAIVNVKCATSILKTGEKVKLNCNTGEIKIINK